MIDTTLQEKIRWVPHLNQRKILSRIKLVRYLIICAGRRFGKSAVCAYIILRRLIQADLEGRPVRIWIVAPTYELTGKVWDYLVPWFIRVFPSQRNGIKLKPNPHLITAGGSRVECKSAENQIGLLGEEVDLMIVDEAPLISDIIYRQYLLPTTLSRKGKMIFIGTPRGKGWFYKRFIDSQDDGSAFLFSSLDGVSVTKEELERIRKEYPDERLFQQEYYASFIENSGQVFLDVELITVPKDKIYRAYSKGHNYTFGVDIAKTEDFTVFTVLDTSDNNVVYWKRFQGIDYPMQIEQIVATSREYGNARIVLDTTGLGRPIYDLLLQRGVFVDDFTFSGKSKEELIGKLRLYISQRWLSIPDEFMLLNELNSFEYKLRNERTGEPLRNIQYGAPKGYHDDCVDSLALAVWGLIGKPREIDPSYYISQELKRRAKRPVDNCI